MIENALRAAGIDFPGPFLTDDKIHRFKARGDHDANSWYVLHPLPGDVVVGAFGCWKRQLVQKWSSKSKSELTATQWGEVSKAWQSIEAQRRKEEELAQAEVRKKVAHLWRTDPAKVHPYLKMKGVGAYGVRISEEPVTDGWLALPLRDAEGVYQSAQFIADDGTKRFYYQGRVAGCWFDLYVRPDGPLVICEGYATGASIHEATGWAVACAMNCGNLAAVSKSLRELFPNRTLLIAADNDARTDGNPGLTKAKTAAKASRCLVALPDFCDCDTLPPEANPTDFNDLHRAAGLNEVRLQLQRAFPIIARSIGEAQHPAKDDPTELLRDRFLCECGQLLVSGPSGMGKSSWMLQCFALWSNGLPAFGIEPAKPLSIVFVQAENDDGDMAEMRDGICRGLNFTEAQRREFFHNVRFFTTNGETGQKFCSEVVRPLLDLHPSNLFGIDPTLAYLGGNFKDQEVVGGFLRNMLNPQLREHRTACMMMHHTNKPMQGKEKANWVNGELAYLGGGSQEFTNWARAILSMQGTGQHGVYKLHAAKRGGRLNWRDVDGFPAYEKIICHSKERGVIYWTEQPIESKTAPDGTIAQGKPPGRRSLVEAIAYSNLHDFCQACTPAGEGLNEISKRLESHLASNKKHVSLKTCTRAVGLLVENGKIAKGPDSLFRKGENS